jgi:hypothetical protein
MFVAGLRLKITQLSARGVTAGVPVKRPDGSVEIARQYSFEGFTQPNHTCEKPDPLKAGDYVRVERDQAEGPHLLVKGPCGCDYMFYQPMPSN